MYVCMHVCMALSHVAVHDEASSYVYSARQAELPVCYIHIYACPRVRYIFLCVRHVCTKLIAFEFAGEDRDRRENPVLSLLKIAFLALHKRG
jgi:hypothetical protein